MERHLRTTTSATITGSRMRQAAASGSIAPGSIGRMRRHAGSCTGSSRDVMTPYAELQVTSNFSFLRGASHPDELVKRARELGHGAIAITDRHSLAGVVRAYKAAETVG